MLDDGNCPGFSVPSSCCGGYFGKKRNISIFLSNPLTVKLNSESELTLTFRYSINLLLVHGFRLVIRPCILLIFQTNVVILGMVIGVLISPTTEKRQKHASDKTFFNNIR